MTQISKPVDFFKQKTIESESDITNLFLQQLIVMKMPLKHHIE
jgi:hypothetical protein